MTEMLSFKSLSTGKIGVYPKDHARLDKDLVPVDSNGDICLPCMGVKSELKPETKTEAKITAKEAKNG